MSAASLGEGDGDGGGANGIPFSTIYCMQAKTVDSLLNAMKLDMLPDEGIELVLGMGGQKGRVLYGAFQTLLRYGRISRNMLEQAMCYNPTSYREYVILWIRSLPPDNRSHYTAALCKEKFKNLPWDTDPKFPNYFNQVGTMGNESLDTGDNFQIRRTKPPVPLGDNRHDPRQAKAARLAEEFYNLFSYNGLIFNGPTSPPNLAGCPDPENLDVLRNYGSLFGIDSPELPWDGTMEGIMTISEMMLRAWNVLYSCQRLSLTELECALVQGNVREFMSRAVDAALYTAFDGEPFAKHGRSTLSDASNFLRGDNRDLQGNTAPENFALVFTHLAVDESLDESFLECDYCGSDLDKKKQCSRCTTAMYCNGDCHKMDWTRHKPLCSRYK